jgi:mxaJ protein
MRRTLVAAALVALACQHAPGQSAPALRVCADPNNLPFSDQSGAGFENRIAALLAGDRHERLEYTWWAQRRGFVRNTLNAGLCDVVIGMPRGSELVRTTRRYYRSGYVFVTRQDRRLDLASIDDPRLRSLRVGVQLIGDDFANTPPAHALAAHGIVGNVIGYPVYGDYARPNPLSPILSAVDHGDVDAAIVWGPTAGYFARRGGGRLALSPPVSSPDEHRLPFAFDMAMAVRRGDEKLAAELDGFIARRQGEIAAILSEFGVPLVEGD